MMNKKERLEAFFNNEEMDHVPVGLWRHMDRLISMHR